MIPIHIVTISLVFITVAAADFIIRLKDVRVTESETAEFTSQLTQENIQVETV